LPGIEFNWQWALLPIANFSLLFRDIMTEIAGGSGAGLSGEGETGSVPVLVKRFGEETIVAVPFD